MDIRPQAFAHRRPLKSEMASIHEGAEFVLKILQEAGLPDVFNRQIRLVVDEALANAISHGSGVTETSIVLSCQIIDGAVQILVEDFQGRVFDPEYFRRIALMKDWRKGGRGIQLMEAIMDHMSYLIEEGNHTLLFLQKALPPQNTP